MKTGNVKMACPKCNSKELRKKGFRKSKKNQVPIRQYYCFDCKARFTRNTLSKHKNQRRLDLNKKVAELYCEGNTLRGIARLLDCSYNTVVAKFRFMSNLAKEQHLKALENGEIITTYVQYDEMETFEGDKSKTLGIELAVRPKTYEIVSAKVCRIPAKGGLAISPTKRKEYSKTVNRTEAIAEMAIEISKAANEKGITIQSDGKFRGRETVQNIMDNANLETTNPLNKDELWRLNHICAKLRHHMSRLNRKTWATTKSMDRLQMHLDLFIAYQNKYTWDY